MEWEKWLIPYLNSGRRAIDAGANTGIWTRRMSEKFDRVEAFEPNLECHPLEVPDNVLVHAIALWDSSEKIGLIPGIAAGPEGSISNARTQEKGDELVEARPLDSYDWDDVDLIKVDTEGAEVKVLLGAYHTIRHCSPFLIIEVHSYEDGKEIREMLWDWGYEIKRVRHPEQEKQPGWLRGRNYWIVGRAR